jgi:hypothetical protein
VPRPALRALLIVALGCAAVDAHAEGLEVSTRRCNWLDDAELGRLTRLELGPSAATLGADAGLSVDFACSGDDVTIGLASQASGIRVERRVTGACCEDVDPERTLALLSLGLFDAARTLLGVGRDPSGASERTAAAGAAPNAAGAETTVVLPAVGADGQPVSEPLPAPANPAAVTMPAAVPQPPAQAPVQALPTPEPLAPRYFPVQRAMDAPDATSPPPVHQIGASARLRVWHLTRPVTSYAVGLDYRGWPWRRVGLGAWSDAAFGSARRNRGDIDVRVVRLGASLDWRMIVFEPFTLEVGGRSGLALVNLQGDSSDPETGTGSITGLTGSLGVRVAPTLRSGGTMTSLPIELGGLLRAPRAEIDGDDPVQLDGLTFAVGLAFSYGWGEPDDTTSMQATR